MIDNVKETSRFAGISNLSAVCCRGLGEIDYWDGVEIIIFIAIVDSYCIILRGGSSDSGCITNWCRNLLRRRPKWAELWSKHQIHTDMQTNWVHWRPMPPSIDACRRITQPPRLVLITLHPRERRWRQWGRKWAKFRYHHRSGSNVTCRIHWIRLSGEIFTLKSISNDVGDLNLRASNSKLLEVDQSQTKPTSWWWSTCANYFGESRNEHTPFWAYCAYFGLITCFLCILWAHNLFFVHTFWRHASLHPTKTLTLKTQDPSPHPSRMHAVQHIKGRNNSGNSINNQTVTNNNNNSNNNAHNHNT